MQDYLEADLSNSPNPKEGNNDASDKFIKRKEKPGTAILY
jgi:hypothetical protein